MSYESEWQKDVKEQLTEIKTAVEGLRTAMETGGDLATAVEAIQAALEAGGDMADAVAGIQTAVETGGGLAAPFEAGGAVVTALTAIATAFAITGRVEPLYTNSANATELGNSTDEQFCDRTYTLAAAKMRAGEWLKIRFSIKVTGAMSGGGNLTVKVYVGTQVVFTSGAYAAAQNDYISGELLVRLRTGNAAVVEEMSVIGAPGTAVPTRKQTTGLTIDPAAAQLVRVSLQFAAANAANVATLQELTIDAHHV